MNKYLFFFTIILSVGGCSKSDELMLTAYECERKEFSMLSEDYLNCSGSCKKITWEDEDDKKLRDTKFLYGFTTNKDSNSVLYKIYKNNDIVHSEVFENCKIFDKKNWDCSSKKKIADINSEENIKMNNGIFIKHSQWKNYSTNRVANVFYAICGK